MNLSAIISYDEKIDPLSMNISSEAATSKPEPSFENTINYIKDNNLKIIASATTNPSDITSIEDYFDQLCINNRFESEKFEQEPTFEKTINDIKANHLKSITSIGINISAITSDKTSLSSEHLNTISCHGYSYNH